MNAIVSATGLEVQSLQSIAAAAGIVNASTVNTPAGEAAFPSDPSLAAAEQQRDDARTGDVGTTIAQLFGVNSLIIAEGQYRGNTIFYSAAAFSQLGAGYLMYTMFHESFHLAGLSDAQVEQDLGIPQSVVKSLGSRSITFALVGLCGR